MPRYAKTVNHQLGGQDFRGDLLGEGTSLAKTSAGYLDKIKTRERGAAGKGLLRFRCSLQFSQTSFDVFSFDPFRATVVSIQ
jgi:hypothetical protein